jgi:hypothetical protein
MISFVPFTSARFLRPSACRLLARCLSSSLSVSSSRERPSISPVAGPDKFNYNTSLAFDESPDSEHVKFPLVTADNLTALREPPTRVKMLVRDFIQDSLYNPHYGYFPQQATILTSAESSFNFASLRDSVEFQEEVAKRYADYKHGDEQGPGRQLWHTPTELFKVNSSAASFPIAYRLHQPWYGQAIAKCLVAEYLLKYFPYEDFIIYEIGAGNGTLALNILDYIRGEHPEVYDRTRYNIVEISNNLVELQTEKLKPVHACVKIMHQSAFRWTRRECAPCFFVAMEVAVSPA